MASPQLVGAPPVEKTPSGIAGFDQITGGGLPKGRSTLVCGGPGSGKTIFAVEFLVRGAELGEPGVFLAFEESSQDIASNVASLGFDLAKLQSEKLLVLDHVELDPAEIEETGGYSLDGLFVRLAYAIESVGAKRVAIDTLEVLFSSLKDAATVRADTHRLFRFLKEKGITAVVTAEAGTHSLTRMGLEEYVSDCVISLTQSLYDQSITRYLRVVKYRGSTHGTNEYPFLIDHAGFSVVPATSLQLDYTVNDERVSSGVPGLDSMLGGAGFFRTSTVLVSGSAGSGKSILAANLANATCSRGERCLYFAFEESPGQIVRNMRSVGIDLKHWLDDGKLQLRSNRPSLYGLEMHLAAMYRAVEEFEPRTVILDPISAFSSAGSTHQIKAMLVRLFDWLKTRQVTGLVTCLKTGDDDDATVGISSLIDTWLEVRELELSGERNRTLYLLKSRGMRHSNQVRELLISDTGISLADVVHGPSGVLLGSAKASDTARQTREQQAMNEDAERHERLLEAKREALEARVTALRAEYAAEEEQTRRKLQSSFATAQSARDDLDSISRTRTDAGNGAKRRN